MNQILITERQEKNKKIETIQENNENEYITFGDLNENRNNKINQQSIIKFFAIAMIIFGIALSSNGAYAMYQNNIAIENVAKPTIYIEREDSENVIINIYSDIGIKTITYSVNGNSKTMECNLETDKEIHLKLEKSSNDIIVTVKDKKKQESTYQKTITKGPTLSLTPNTDEAMVEITAESGNKIDYIEYWWDEENSKKEMINNETANISIDVIPEEHTLNVKVVDVEGMETTKSVKTIGVQAPTVEVTTNKVDFVIEASDDEEITKVEIIFNGETLPTEEVNSKTYKKEDLKLKQGLNKIIVTVYNNNNVSTIKKVKYELK